MLGNKIKIAFLTSYLPKEGPVQVIYNIINNIDFSKFEVTIITLKKEKENSLIEKFNLLPIKIVQLDSSGLFKFLRLPYQLKFWLNSNDIHILHSHCFISLLLNCFTTQPIIKVHTIHIYPSFQYIAMKGQLVGRIMNLLTKYSIKRINYPIACSESVKLLFQQNDDINVACVQNGVARLKRADILKSDLKKKLNLDPDIDYLVSVGRLSPEKNFIFLIEQFKKLNLKSHKLIIVGDGSQFGELAKLADESIILTGFKQNVSDYLFASDYYISTSLTEGMPLSVLEAMSAGLPLILSDIEPHKEIFKNSKTRDIGFVFKNNQGSDFREKVNSVLNMNHLNLQENVISLYTKCFSAEKMSRRYQDHYFELIRKKYK